MIMVWTEGRRIADDGSSLAGVGMKMLPGRFIVSLFVLSPNLCEFYLWHQ